MNKIIFCLLFAIAASYFPAMVLSEGNLFFIENGDSPCLLVNMNSSITIQYLNTSNVKKEITSVVESSEPNQIGQCETPIHQNYSFIKIKTVNNIELILHFKRFGSQSRFLNASISFSYNNPIFENPQKTGNFSESLNIDDPLSQPGQYYECNSEKINYFGNDVTLTTSYLKIQAFEVVNGNYSDTGVLCETLTTTEEPLPGNMTTITETPEPENMTTTTETPEPENMTTTAEIVTTTSVMTTSVPITTTSPYPTYYVKDSNDIVCLILRFRFSLQLTNPDPINKDKATRTFKTDNVIVKSTGMCSSNTNNITLTWAPQESPMDKFHLTLIYEKSGKSGYALTATSPSFSMTKMEVEFVVNNKTFPESMIKQSRNEILNHNITSSKSVPLGSTYTCNAQITYELDKTNKVLFDHLEVEAFRNSTSESFAPKGSECPEDQKPTPGDNIVPIVVGVVLAALVIVVLIAYLIGRRRHRTGYDNI